MRNIERMARAIFRNTSAHVKSRASSHLAVQVEGGTCEPKASSGLDICTQHHFLAERNYVMFG